MERVQAELKGEVAYDGATCGSGVAHKRHGKGPKEEETKRPKDDEAMKTKKSKGAIDMPVVDAGSKEKFGKKRKTEKPDEDEAMDMLVDPGSKEKLKTWRLSRELLEYLRTKEVMGFLATETPRLLWPNITGELFGKELREEIAAHFEENKEFDAYVLYQYRSKGYAEIQEEVDEEPSA